MPIAWLKKKNTPDTGLSREDKMVPLISRDPRGTNSVPNLFSYEPPLDQTATTTTFPSHSTDALLRLDKVGSTQQQQQQQQSKSTANSHNPSNYGLYHGIYSEKKEFLVNFDTTIPPPPHSRRTFAPSPIELPSNRIPSLPTEGSTDLIQSTWQCTSPVSPITPLSPFSSVFSSPEAVKGTVDVSSPGLVYIGGDKDSSRSKNNKSQSPVEQISNDPSSLDPLPTHENPIKGASNKVENVVVDKDENPLISSPGSSCYTETSSQQPTPSSSSSSRRRHSPKYHLSVSELPKMAPATALKIAASSSVLHLSASPTAANRFLDPRHCNTHDPTKSAESNIIEKLDLSPEELDRAIALNKQYQNQHQQHQQPQPQSPSTLHSVSQNSPTVVMGEAVINNEPNLNPDLDCRTSVTRAISTGAGISSRRRGSSSKDSHQEILLRKATSYSTAALFASSNKTTNVRCESPSALGFIFEPSFDKVSRKDSIARVTNQSLSHPLPISGQLILRQNRKNNGEFPVVGNSANSPATTALHQTPRNNARNSVSSMSSSISTIQSDMSSPDINLSDSPASDMSFVFGKGGSTNSPNVEIMTSPTLSEGPSTTSISQTSPMTVSSPIAAKRSKSNGQSSNFLVFSKLRDKNPFLSMLRKQQQIEESKADHKQQQQGDQTKNQYLNSASEITLANIRRTPSPLESELYDDELEVVNCYLSD